MSPCATERMVQRCFEQMLENTDFGLRMHWWHRMHHYISRRTPERIRRMERERGLA